MATVAELQVDIREEEQRHVQTMEELRSQIKSLSALVAEQQEYMHELTTRASELRLAKSKPEGSCNVAADRPEINTGCSVVDNILLAVGEGLETSTGKCQTVLNKISAAAAQAVIPSSEGRPSTLSSSNSATRTTDVAFISRNGVRGTRDWVKKHCKKCPACGELNSKPRPWEPPKKADNGKTNRGNDYVPNLRLIPGKNFRSFSVTFIRELCGGTVLDLLRISTVIAVKGHGDTEVSNPEEVAAKISTLLVELAREEMEKLREVSKKASWCNGSRQGSEKFAAAVEMLLHNIDTRVEAYVLPHTSDSKPLPPGCVPMKINVAITMPLFLSLLQPFVELWGSERDREYMVQGVLKPALNSLSKLFGMDGIVDRGVTVLLKAVEALANMSKGRSFIGSDAPPPGKSKSGSSSGSQRAQLWRLVHSVILQMALLGTRIELECAIPAERRTRNLEGAKKDALKVAKAFLQRLLPPAHGVCVSMTDQAAADVVLWLRRMPTRILEILNNAFSSNRRVPSSQRMGVIDHLASPRLKTNYALNNFSEIVIDVFRPYAPNSGMMTMEEKSKGEKARIGACAPVVDLPCDIVRANVDVAAWAKQKEERLLRKSTIDVNPNNGGGRTRKIMEKTDLGPILSNFVRGLRGLELEVGGLLEIRVEICLPFGVALHSGTEPPSEVIYLQIENLRSA